MSGAPPARFSRRPFRTSSTVSKRLPLASTKKDLDVLTTSENLQGLTPVFSDLHLVRSENGQVVLDTESGPLAEVLGRIENRTSYGEMPSGRSLADHFAAEPYGWEFETVRLFVLALLRAGKIQMTSGGQPIDSAVSVEARNVFGNNNLFRQATFQPKKGLDFPQVVEASESFKDTFGQERRRARAGCRRARDPRAGRAVRGRGERQRTRSSPRTRSPAPTFSARRSAR